MEPELGHERTENEPHINKKRKLKKLLTINKR